nr:hypothetical protein [Tanacetum cinerariifolium]GEV90574.1 hypothetical protein [Tanacetum cinerariifolium]
MNELPCSAQYFEANSDELSSSKFDDSVPTSPVHDRYKLGEGYHDVPLPYTRTFMPPKPDLVFNDAFKASETVINMDKGVIDSGCSRHMTRNISYLLDFEAFNGGYVAFGRNLKGGKISATECVVLSSDYKLPDKNHVLLRVPRENNMYNVDLKNVVPSGGLTCLFAKATLDESNIWHRRLGHINFKNMNKLVKGNLVRGLQSKLFENNHTCVACKKDKQHRPSCKSKPVSSVSHPLQRLHMDLFGPTFVKSLNKKSYCLVVTDDYRIMREFSVARTPQHNRVAERKNRTIIEAGSGPKWLFDIDTLTQSMNYQPLVVGYQPNHNACIKENLDVGKVRKETISAQQYVMLLLWSTGLTDPKNTDDVAAFDVKENENAFYVSPSGSEKTKKHDDKAKGTDKGKSHVDLSIRVRDLRDEFEEFSFNSTNRVNAVSAPVTSARPNPTNNTNSFNTASPSDTAVRLNFRINGKSSCLYPSNYPDDPDMPALEDIVYSDDEKDVGTEVDFSNLETNISVSPILTTRVHKDHPVTQIIGDLTSAPQTRSMERMVKEQGRLNQINDEDFHTCMFTCFLSQEEPKRIHQALKDPS